MQGKTINGFELKRLLGVGGMAEVWYAENEIHKAAAVKILNEDLSHNANIVERFRNEAEIMVRLDHPNIRQVFGYGTIDGRPSIVMEYLEGNDMKALMKQGRRFNNDELVRWWNQMVDALNYTHSEDIIHRDIKPSNIFIDKRGNVKLLDFGIAKVRESITMTQTGAMLGTLMYMSPEQVQDSKHLDYRSDVYSLAVSFVHLLTGKRPYDSDTMSDYAIRKGIVEQELDLSAVPSAWRTFLKPYLAKDPADRPTLRPFAADSPSSGGFAIRPTENRDLQFSSDGEGTVAEEKPQPIFGPSTGSETSNNKPSTGNRHSGPSFRENGTLSPAPKDNPKNKKGLWIAVAVAAVAAIVAIMFLRQPEVVPSSPPSPQPQPQPSPQSQQSLTGSANGHEWVDLGLPSGTLWATCNVGADNPEDYGNYYAWGETSTKSTYNWSTYRYANGNYNRLTKYCNQSSYGNNGFIDNLTNLQASDDPATANWGDGWLTPSKIQWDELLANTTNHRATLNGVEGRHFTSKINGQAIFLPDAGFRWNSEHKGSAGYYLSSSLPEAEPTFVWFLSSLKSACGMNRNSRDDGYSVRPVRQK